MRDLFVRHGTRVFRFLLRVVGDAAAAEDLLNEVFIEIWRHAGQFEARSKVSTWMLAIAHLRAAAWRRRRASDQLDDDATAWIKDPGDNPEVVAQKQGSCVVIRECLKRLSPAHRTVLDLIYYHEQSIAEVARIIGVPENTVKTRARTMRASVLRSCWRNAALAARRSEAKHPLAAGSRQRQRAGRCRLRWRDGCRTAL